MEHVCLPSSHVTASTLLPGKKEKREMVVVCLNSHRDGGKAFSLWVLQKHERSLPVTHVLWKSVEHG